MGRQTEALVDRRAFIGTLASGLLASPLAAEAQVPSKLPKIGFLQGTLNENAVAFVNALRDAGYVDGQNAVLETRIYGVTFDRLPQLAKDLVALTCDVIFATGPYAIKAAIAATNKVPIVGLDLESDPIARGWAKSLSRPGGNFTGLFLDLPELGGKQIQLLREVVPEMSRVGVLWDSNIGDVQFRATQTAARTLGVVVQSLPMQRAEDLQDVFDRAVRERLRGVIVLSSPIILRERLQIASFALIRRLPTISLFTLLPRSGGLIAYGPNLPGMYARAVIYVDKILKGAKPADLPIERPTRFELVINLKTAKALGLTIPPSLLQRADPVIE
jgi:putative tryptophan/tyrosine transport system substrate-binding protein